MWYLIFCLPFVSVQTLDCPNVIPVSPFDLAQYSKGRWFEIARYASFEIEKDTDCVYFDYVSEENLFKYKWYEVANGETFTFDGTTSYAAGVKDVGTITDLANMKGGTVNVTYNVLDIDYQKYAVLYYCKYDDKSKTNVESAWILSRTMKLVGDARAAADKFITNHQFIDDTKFVWNHYTHEICQLDL